MVVSANSEIRVIYPVKLQIDFIINILTEVGILELWLSANAEDHKLFGILYKFSYMFQANIMLFNC